MFYADGGGVVSDDISITFREGDGSQRTYFRYSGIASNGIRYDESSQTLVLPSGETRPVRDSSGQAGWIDGEGHLNYSNGTRLSTDGIVLSGPVAGGSSRIFMKDSGAGPGGVSYDALDDSFTTASGMTIPGSHPKGGPAWVNDKGDIGFQDGTLVTSDAVSTTVTRADGSSMTYFTRAGETSTGVLYDEKSSSFITPAGHRIPGKDSAGNPVGVNDKGDLFRDGSIITGDASSTTVIGADGESRTFFADGRSGTAGGTHHDGRTGTFTTAGGHVFKDTDPDGRPRSVDSHGDIHGADGSTIHSTSKSSYTTTHTDGTSETYFSGSGEGPGGTYYDAKDDVFMTDTGHMLPGTDATGAPGHINEKGDIVYADGRIVVTDVADGSITVLQPGGGTKTYGAGQNPTSGTGSSSSSSGGGSGTSSGGDEKDDEDDDSKDNGSEDDDDLDSGDDEGKDSEESEESTSDDSGEDGDEGTDGEDPEENTEGVGSYWGVGPSTDADAILERRRNMARGGRDEGTPPWLTGCGPDRQPVIGPDGSTEGCGSLPVSGPGETEEEEGEPGEIWIWTGSSGGIDDPLGPVSQPGLDGDSERGGLRTVPIFDRLEQLTDPSPHR